LPDQQPDIERIRANGMDLLSPEERRRSDGMKHPLVADRFVLGRILLRRVLARYLDEDPADLAFQYNANGKPEIVDPSGPKISFNLSRSASKNVLAVAAAPAIGVDLEPVDRADTAYRISQRFFSASEIRQLEALGPKAASHALMLWSLKESIVKARGETVWDGLAKISLATEGRRILWSSAGNTERSGWQLATGAFGENHLLALAVKPSSGQGHSPLVFQTFRLGSDTMDPNGFKPEFSTWDPG
jgi:phosphopantetheinyl transferase